jgi:pimeloyl-ACP methyl ester carboxylesterase
LIAFVRGESFSSKVLWPRINAFDASKACPRVEVPVFFLLGRYDRQVSASLAFDYFTRLEAPSKELIWFENSAHTPPYDEPERFNTEVLRIARKIGLLTQAE